MGEGASSVPRSAKKKRHRITRILLMTAGTVCVGLGAVGMVLPILPSTPFLLLAAACYCRSSDKLYNWLITNKHFGALIKNYREGKGLTVKTKITAVTVLWTTILVSTVFFVNLLVAQIAMIFVAVAVSTYLLRLPTFRKVQSSS